MSFSAFCAQGNCAFQIALRLADRGCGPVSGTKSFMPAPASINVPSTEKGSLENVLPTSRQVQNAHEECARRITIKQAIAVLAKTVAPNT